MVYTPDEKRKMDNVLAVFAKYTARHTGFDVAYSDKTGYVRLITDACADHCFFTISGFDDLMDMFCMEIVSEEVERQFRKNKNLENWDVDYDSIRLRIQGYIDGLEEAYQAQAAKVADKYILERGLSPYLP